MAASEQAGPSVCSQDKVSGGQGGDGHRVARLAGQRLTEQLPGPGLTLKRPVRESSLD